MKKNRIYHYCVEGEDEKSLLNALKTELRCIESGRVETFNAIQNRFTKARVRPLKPGTTVVLLYDTDVENNADILQYNVDFLKKQSGIKEVLCIPQVKNLEQELCRACGIKDIRELTKSKTKSDYKSDIISCTNLGARLAKCQFDISKFWTGTLPDDFKKFGNDAEKIKIYEKIK